MWTAVPAVDTVPPTTLAFWGFKATGDNAGAEDEMEGIMLVTMETDSRDPAGRGTVRTTEESSEGFPRATTCDCYWGLSFNHWPN